MIPQPIRAFYRAYFDNRPFMSKRLAKEWAQRNHTTEGDTKILDILIEYRQ